MAKPTFDLDALKASNFVTTNRGDLAKAHNILMGYPPDEHEDADVIRGKLREITKAVPAPDPLLSGLDAPVPPVPANVTPINKNAEADLRKMPNLGPNGAWGGLQMGLVWTKRNADDMEEVIIARWETRTEYLLPGEKKYMPYPLYRAFIDAVDRKIVKEWSHDNRKELPSHMRGMLICEESTVITPKYILTELGALAGTEDLPRDYLDHFQRVAKRTQMFRGVSRTLLLKINAILFGEAPITQLVGVTDTDLRVKIASSLGPDYEHLMDEELHGSAATA